MLEQAIQESTKIYGYLPDKGCKWGGMACLTCTLPECVLDNPKLKHSVVQAPSHDSVVAIINVGDAVRIVKGRTKALIGVEAEVVKMSAKYGIRIQVGTGEQRWVSVTSLELMEAK